MCVGGVFVWASWKTLTDTETVVEEKELKSQQCCHCTNERKRQKGHYWKPGWMLLFFFMFVKYDIMPGSGQIPSLGFWTDCELWGSLLNCSAMNHYPRQWVYTHVTPLKWIAISFFFTFLSRPSSSEVLKDARNTEFVSTFSLFFKAVVLLRCQGNCSKFEPL